jgi:hypothetical protein
MGRIKQPVRSLATRWQRITFGRISTKMVVKKPGTVPGFLGFAGLCGTIRDANEATQPMENARFISISTEIAEPAASPSQAGRRRFDPGRPLHFSFPPVAESGMAVKPNFFLAIGLFLC